MRPCKFCKSGNVIKYSVYEYFDVFECQDCKLWFWEPIVSCCRKPQERVVVQQYDFNTFHIRIQCDHCGGCLNMKNPLNHEAYDNKIKGEFSTEMLINWKQAKKSESDYIYNISKQLKFANSNYSKYLNHLQSVYWKNIRLQVLLRDENTCQLCKTALAQDVHHLTYINLGNEKLEDLISYCRPCHALVHEHKN